MDHISRNPDKIQRFLEIHSIQHETLSKGMLQLSTFVRLTPHAISNFLDLPVALWIVLQAGRLQDLASKNGSSCAHQLFHPGQYIGPHV